MQNRANTQNALAYDKIKTKAMLTNSVTIHSVSIAGEAISGLFSVATMLKTMHLHFENDTYHPFLFHYMVGASVGSVCICLMLNSMFLYETYGKKIALEYLAAVYDFIDFDGIRSLFFDVDGTKPLDFIADPLLILKNLYKDGSLCSRKALAGLLIGNHPRFKFDNRREYFVSKEFKEWLDDREGRLFNVFFVCYSAEQSKMVTFTGNINRYRNGINFITYERLTHSNLVHAVLCSSDIPLLYPVESLDGANFATDGAAAERNQFFYLQSLINCSHFFSSSQIYGRMLAFLGVTVKNDGFLVIHNKINLQHSFENLQAYDVNASLPIMRSIRTILTYPSRAAYNAKMNVPIMSLLLQQPYIRQFSTLNLNDIVRTSYDHRRNTVARNIDVLKKVTIRTKIPLFSDGNPTKAYRKFNVITSNQLISTFLHQCIPPERVTLVDGLERPLPDNPTIELNVCYFDMNIRTVYPLDDDILLYLLLGYKPDHIVDNVNNVLKMGIVSASMLYDINQRQGLATVDKVRRNTDIDSTDKSASDSMNGDTYPLHECIIEPAYELFLGQSQS